MTKLRYALVALASMVAASSASAANYVCPVNPSMYLGLSGGGMVTVAVNGGIFTNICNVSALVEGVTPEACSAWYSTLLTWRAVGKTGNIYFNPDNPSNRGTASCSQLTPGTTHIPYHIDGQ